jgi:cobalt-zinc-cadmium resistance protein CzcA
VLALALLAGCASYAPRPLDGGAELRALATRTLDDDAFAEPAAIGVDAPASGSPPAFDSTDGLDEPELVGVALRLNPDLRARRAEVGEAEAALITAGLWPNPEITLSPKWGIGAASGASVDADALFQLLRPGERDAQRNAPVLRLVMRHRMAVLALAVCVLAGAVIVARGLGAEFVPRLSEGAIAINVVRLAGTDLGESVRYNSEMERALVAAFPDEVAHVWSRAGSAEVATDPMGVELTDLFLSLKPRSQWKRAATQAQLVELVQRELRDLPGQRLAFSQPIEMRMIEMVAGARGDVAVKLYGDDLEVLTRTAGEVGRIVGAIPGAADMSTEQVTGQPVLQIRVDQDALSRLGLPAKSVMDLVESIGSKPLGEVVEGQLRFPLVARLPDRYRRDADAIRAIQLSTPTGQRIPLSDVAKVEEVEGPSTINREWGQRRVTVSVNVRGRDVGSFVAEAQRQVAEMVKMPPSRYRIEWGGQFESIERARTRLMIVVPLVLVIIFALLYATYQRALDAVRVFTGVPFAVVGGVVALWLRGMPFLISAAVGFIALSGVAVLGDMVLVSYVRQLIARGHTLADAVREAGLTRLRPVLMTALVASLGFVPMALSTGVGAEVQRPLATVVIGGVISSTLLTLLVLPALYLMFGSPVVRSPDGGEENEAAADRSRRSPELADVGA